jgi:hypothetical protein
MWKQRIVLKHRVQWSHLWFIKRHIAVVDQYLTTVWSLKTTDHPERGCLAAPRWTKQREELARANV